MAELILGAKHCHCCVSGQKDLLNGFQLHSLAPIFRKQYLVPLLHSCRNEFACLEIPPTGSYCHNLSFLNLQRHVMVVVRLPITKQPCFGYLEDYESSWLTRAYHNILYVVTICQLIECLLRGSAPLKRSLEVVHHRWTLWELQFS